MTGPRAIRLLPSALLVVLGAVSPAAADLVVLRSGAVVSVRGHRVDGDRITVFLRGGGEAAFDRALVARIAPDEVPEPEPSAARAAGEAARRDGPFVPSARSVPYASLIADTASAHGVDAALVHAVIEAESGYDPRARSAKGARGLMQLMPATAREYTRGNIYDPATNVDAGVRHLRGLLDRLDLPLALAAYNAGERAVRRHQGIPPYPETEQYVRRILARLGR
ncbi:MAG: lytic transglycosylase domain-containing protein [Acidobacteriota bacterium]